MNHKQKLYPIIGILFLCTIIICSCKREYTPKPLGYNRIEIPTYEYKTFSNSFFSFEYSNLATIRLVNINDTSFWFNIVYPKYNATIYCSYIKTKKKSLSRIIEDSYHLAYNHRDKANDLKEYLYQSRDSERSISGAIFELTGNVPTPIQFFLTDSFSNFLRGSFYYDNKLDLDSIAPITNMINDNIHHIFESVKFN